MTTRCRMTHGLSKSKLMAFRQCPKRLWLDVHRPDLLPADLDHAPQIVNGNEVGAGRAHAAPRRRAHRSGRSRRRTRAHR